MSLLANLFGWKKNSPKPSNKIPQPPADPPATINTPQTYLIHDNGGRPFQVTLTKTTFAVHRQSKIAEKGKGWTTYEGSYDKPIIKPTKYLKVFVGRDPNYGKRFDGNTILVQTARNSYTFIGSTIYSLVIDEDILGYKSPIFGSDVAYPYAVGKTNTYLFIEDTYIPNETLRTEDPYIHLYNQDKKDWDIKKRQNQERAHKAKHKFKSVKIIQKRL